MERGLFIPRTGNFLMLISFDGHLILWEGGIHHAGIEDLVSAIMEGCGFLRT